MYYLKRREELDKKIKELYDERIKLKEEVAQTYEGEGYEKLIEGALENTPNTFPLNASVACQGVEGAYSQKAAEKLFRNAQILYMNNFENVFKAIEQGLCEYGVLPIENSTAGSVNKIYDLMADHKFYIVRSTRVKIEHNLMVKPGKSIKDIKNIYSHAHAIAQCEDYLKTLKDVKIHEVSNTAAAAMKVADSNDGTIGAICSMDCAEIYGLEVAAANIQDNDSNYTRFICISKVPEIYPGADKTSIMATVAHRPGMLYDVLKTFNDKGFNLDKLESRPIPASDFEFRFYFDFEASVYHKEFINTLNELDGICESMTYLGSYNEKI